MDWVQHLHLAWNSIFVQPSTLSMFGLMLPSAVLMLALGLLTGLVVGATPGLAGPMAMAVALPILISAFGVNPDALLPVFGFLIGVMKGATVGGAVPAILFNTPGTPDAFMTTQDGYPMTQRGESNRALRIAHRSSVMGDTFSDVVLFICAPFLAVLVEKYLDFPEKTALILLSLSFIAAVMGQSVAKGLISVALGMLAAFVATGEEFHPRLTLGMESLGEGFSLTTAVMGVLVLGEVFRSIEDMAKGRLVTTVPETPKNSGSSGLRDGDTKLIWPYVWRSSIIGTVIGAMPGVGSTLAAALGYSYGRELHDKRKTATEPSFGHGAPQGIAATEAANSAVSGANLIPVLSLGIPGNAAAVFLILAADSIGGFNPGPSVFRMNPGEINAELVVVFGIFILMTLGNLLNWTLGGWFMRSLGLMAKIPNATLMPAVLLVTLTAIYVQSPSIGSLWIAMGFGVLGYLMRRLSISVLPFVIAFILARNLEELARAAFSATGSDPWFLFKSPLALTFTVLAVASVLYFSMRSKRPQL
jgi:putative tricarboxylic transport membrane protein